MPRTWFEQLVVSSPPRRRSRFGIVASAGTHAGLLAALVVLPVVDSSALPEPANTPPTPIPEWRVTVRITPPTPAPPAPPRPRLDGGDRPTRPATAPDAVASAPRPAPAGVTADNVAPLDRLHDDSDPLCLTGCDPNGVAGPVPDGSTLGSPSGVGSVGGDPPAVRPGGEIREPLRVHYVAPEYPELARRARVEGIVILECVLAETGEVTDVTVLRGHPLLDPAAEGAVRQWRYRPTLLNGVPVRIVMTVTVRFTLDDGR